MVIQKEVAKLRRDPDWHGLLALPEVPIEVACLNCEEHYSSSEIRIDAQGLYYCKNEDCAGNGLDFFGVGLDGKVWWERGEYRIGGYGPLEQRIKEDLVALVKDTSRYCGLLHRRVDATCLKLAEFLEKQSKLDASFIFLSRIVTMLEGIVDDYGDNWEREHGVVYDNDGVAQCEE